MTIVKGQFTISESVLPEGWDAKPLRKVATSRKGKKPSRLEGEQFPGSIPYLDIEAFEYRRIRRFADTNSSVVVEKGSVLVVWDGARCGLAGNAPTRGALGSTIAELQLGKIDASYVRCFLDTCYETVNSNHRGTGIPHVEPELFWSLELPVAPLAEQKRIAAKVEELLARVNAAREQLARVRATLKRFRQAVLAAACSGRLTADWRETHAISESGHGLLERILQERAAENQRLKIALPHLETAGRNDIPESWAWTSVGFITKNFDGCRVPVKAAERARKQGPYPYYGASGIIDSVDDYLFDGDYLLIAEDGANLVYRSTPIAFRAFGKFWVNNHAHVVQTWGAAPLAYLEAHLNGTDLQDSITGSAQPKLTQKAMNAIPVSFPPLEEQHEIVRRVEALFKLADAIEKRVAAAATRAEKLTQAILAKAFRGELVPTEAELARREGRDYEPASALLARIQDERRAAPSLLSP
jgi:type I restriction enzyme S subunit